mmetsp:Transcript_42514/g.112081  ORF Transcript_42514/g.112081 Transcript_42514/m.112081 type:complete len:256 (-) Transcript_42514:323-1090(-)
MLLQQLLRQVSAVSLSEVVIKRSNGRSDRQPKITDLVGLYFQAIWAGEKFAEYVIRLDVQVHQGQVLRTLGGVDGVQATADMQDDLDQVVALVHVPEFSSVSRCGLLVLPLPQVAITQLHLDVKLAVLDPSVVIPHNMNAANVIELRQGSSLLADLGLLGARVPIRCASLNRIALAVDHMKNGKYRREMTVAFDGPLGVLCLEPTAVAVLQVVQPDARSPGVAIPGQAGLEAVGRPGAVAPAAAAVAAFLQRPLR